MTRPCDGEISHAIDRVITRRVARPRTTRTRRPNVVAIDRSIDRSSRFWGRDRAIVGDVGRPRAAHATERTRAATTTTKGACMRSRIAIVNHVPFTSTNARRSVTRARRRQSQSINQSIAVVVVDDRTFGVGPCLNGSRDIRRLTGAYARGVRGDVVVQSSSRRRRRRPVKA